MSRPWVLPDPGRHPYLDRLDGTVARLVHRGVADRHAPEWIQRHRRDWDLVHVHLGLGVPEVCGVAGPKPTDPGRLAAAVEAHRRGGTPIAVTVHDTGTPEPGALSPVEVLQRIGRSVSAVVTLTAGCASTLEAQLGRPVRVIPHGPVLARPARQRLRAHRRLHGPRGPLLLVAGDLPRRLGWTEAIEAASRTVTGQRLHILVAADRVEEVAHATRDRPHVTIGTTAGLADESLHRSVADARALVVPWRWGGHSALIELAADIGTPVVATDVGFLGDQHAVLTARCTDGRIDVDDLAAAMDADVSTVVGDADREAAAEAFEAGHERLYRRLLLGRAVASPRARMAVG
jgi:glycosyltransferase involved in cell wall biosynthesis